MKNIQHILPILLLIALAFPQSGAAQERSTDELHFEVNRIYPYISITKEQLKEAQTLMDLHARYKSAWISTYLSVEISTSYKGKTKKAVSKDDRLSPEQKDLVKMADTGTDISVKVQYLPENTLIHNDPKEMNFTFSIEPESEATYVGGQQQLNQYLKEQAIDRIPAGSFEGYDLAAVQFTITEDGEISNVQLFESSKDETIDQLLLSTIRKMPCWEPAVYADGTKVKQEFVLTVGSMENCMTYLLNIRRQPGE